MGRKKKNARHSVHGRKIHVNKYINQCGKTKKCRKSAVSWRPASKETPFNDMPTYQWPTVRSLVRRARRSLWHFGAERYTSSSGHQQ